MEDPRIRKFAQFLIRSAVELQKGEKILIELHGSETGLMKALVQEAYAVGGKPFIHIFDYGVEGALVQGADAEHMEEIASYELERMKDMDAYIDIRATPNISAWHNVSDEAQRRYRQYYWGPIHLAQRCNHTKWSVDRPGAHQRSRDRPYLLHSGHTLLCHAREPEYPGRRGLYLAGAGFGQRTYHL